ncbi:MAG: 23S rRNA (cytosine(1962)-C(5))-methyltransferase RlmI [Deltaproteobacteria bacterium]|nr:MAG: 23S rRNA (cytosine(1962)-C(5))-methyltransferase RlmI [Deltaproteobacteria bacterium]
MLIVRLKERKEVPILGGHPWIYSGAIEDIKGDSEVGNICRVLDSRGRFVCQGFFNPYSQISVRVLSLGKEKIDRGFFMQRIKAAIGMRASIIHGNTNSFRIVNAEGDGIPGLFADIYSDVVVVQFLCPGIERYRDTIIDILHETYPDHVIHERSDDRSRHAEGLKPMSMPLYGSLSEGEIEILESDIHYLVDVKRGERTGFYLDHRGNRQVIKSIARDRDVLDLFSYTGGFTLAALTGGAKSVVAVDSSPPALDILKRNMDLNRIPAFSWRSVRADVMGFLSQEKETYDLIICDPPPFPKEQEILEKVIRLSMKRLRPGGIMSITTSFPYTLPPDDMIKNVGRAARSTGRRAKVIARLSQSHDFPYLPNHPQGMHLIGYLLHVE